MFYIVEEANNSGDNVTVTIIGSDNTRTTFKISKETEPYLFLLLEDTCRGEHIDLTLFSVLAEFKIGPHQTVEDIDPDGGIVP